MIRFMSRNLKIFFRQKSAVFFSLLGVFIIIGLYLLFLGDVWIASLPGLPGVRALMDTWIVAGIVSVTAVTTSMGAFSILVEDRAGNAGRDFYASPVKRASLVGGYVLTAYLVGLLMSAAALVLGVLYFLVTGTPLPGPAVLLKVLGILLLSVFSSSALVFFCISFFSSTGAFATASTVIGTLIGFLTGIYLPIGSLPGPVQWVVKLFPVSHGGALLRQVMMEDVMSVSFAGAPASAVSAFQAEMGVQYTYGGYTAGPGLHLLVLAGSSVLFLALALWNVSRKRTGR